MKKPSLNKPSTHSLTSLVLISLALSGCAAVPVIGNGQASQRTIDLTDIQEVKIRGKSKIIIREEQNQALEIHADSNIVPRIRVSSSGSSLSIGPSYWFMLFPSNGIEYHLSSQQVEQLASSGNHQLLINSHQELSINSSGKLKIVGQGQTEQLSLSGSGQLWVEGKDWQVSQLQLDRSGRTELDLPAVETLNGSSNGTLIWQPSSTTDHSGFQHSGNWHRDARQ